MKTSFDVVVIGSGFGGGTVALRLAQAGKSVCVLERGRRWRGKNLLPAPGDDPSTPFPELGDSHFFWGRQLWRPGRQRLGLFEMHQMINLQTLLAAGVGGGSLIWSNVVVKAPAEVFQAGWPSALSLAALEPYYRLADPYLRPEITPGIPGHPHADAWRQVKRAEVHKLAAGRVGARWEPVKLAVYFGDRDKAASNGHGRARQLGCNYCGICPAGCPQNAKNTVDITYIAAALALGAEVRAQHLVTAIEPKGDGGYRVHFRRFDDEGRLAEEGTLEAGRVVVSAGTLGTNTLLFKSRKAGFLPNLSPALGTRFSVNGNVLSGALRPGPRGLPVETNNGPAITSMADYGDFVVEDHAGPTWSAGIVGAGNLGRIAAFALAYAGHKPTPEAIARKVQDMLVYVGVGRDSASGRLSMGRLGMLSLAWPGGINAEPVVKAQHEAMAALAASLGRQYVPNILSLFNRPITYHPLGGCAMADSPSDGVVDAFGRVYGHPGLYIADGSIIPTAIGRNPAYTIAALSERVAEQLIRDIG